MFLKKNLYSQWGRSIQATLIINFLNHLITGIFSLIDSSSILLIERWNLGASFTIGFSHVALQVKIYALILKFQNFIEFSLSNIHVLNILNFVGFTEL